MGYFFANSLAFCGGWGVVRYLNSPKLGGREWISTRIFFERLYVFVFRQRGREGEREGEKHPCVVASCVPPTGNLARNPGMCPDWEPNQRPFGSQAGAQSTEPQQPGLYLHFSCSLLHKATFCHLVQTISFYAKPTNIFFFSLPPRNYNNFLFRRQYLLHLDIFVGKWWVGPCIT